MKFVNDFQMSKVRFRKDTDSSPIKTNINDASVANGHGSRKFFNSRKRLTFTASLLALTSSNKNKQSSVSTLPSSSSSYGTFKEHLFKKRSRSLGALSRITLTHSPTAISVAGSPVRHSQTFESDPAPISARSKCSESKV